MSEAAGNNNCGWTGGDKLFFRSDCGAANMPAMDASTAPDGFYDDLVVSVPDTEVQRDESVRAGAIPLMTADLGAYSTAVGTPASLSAGSRSRRR